MDSWEGSKLNEAKEILAYELTSMVHGEEEQRKRRKAHVPYSLPELQHMPTTEISAEDFTDDKIDIVTLLVKCGVCKDQKRRTPCRRAGRCIRRR